jgi:hypothetical protein
MDNIRVYGVDIDEVKCPDKPTSLNDEDFIKEAERQGLVWTLKGFQDQFNKSYSLCDLIIRFIEN